MLAGTLISLALVFRLLAEKKHKLVVTIIGILAGVTLLSIITMIILILRRNRAYETSKDDPNAVSKRSISNRTISIKNPNLHYMEGNLKRNFWKQKQFIFQKYKIFSNSSTRRLRERLLLIHGKYWRRCNPI